MLDATLRPLIDPPLNRLGKHLSGFGLSANTMTGIGFSAGVLASLAIYFHHPLLAASLLVFNRLADGLDGAIARQTSLTDFGGFLDIVCDFIIYTSLVFASGLANPKALGYASFLMFSFIGPMTTFLAYAIIASKRERVTEKRGKKSFYYLGGLCEGTETAFALILACLAPRLFTPICIIFGGLCWLTTLGRIQQARKDFQ